MVLGSHQFQKTGPLSLAIGVFDVLHLGHRKVISSMVDSAKRLGAEPVVLTFDPHPRSVLQDPLDKMNQRVYSLESLQDRLKNMGVSQLVVESFDERFLKQSPEEFWSNCIKKHFDPKSLFVGSQFRFGFKAEGDVDRLKSLALGCDVHGVELLKSEGRVISTTQIKKWILEGAVDKANQDLGNPYLIRGELQEGLGVGGKSLVPTFNLQITEGWLPQTGVYAGYLEGLKSAINIGHAPTVKNTDQPVIEAHLLDARGFVAKDDMALSLVSYIREEKKFASLEELKSQIFKDIQHIKKALH